MKAQAAIEYLVTYSWAILGVIVIIALLFYLGVFNPAIFVAGGNDVYGFATFGVDSFKLTPGGNLTLYLVNNAPYKITVKSIVVSDSNMTGVSPSLPMTMESGESKTVSGQSVYRGAVGDPIRDLRIKIVFDLEGGASGHQDTGVLRGIVEPA